MTLAAVAGLVFFRGMHQRAAERAEALEPGAPSVWDAARFNEVASGVEATSAAALAALAAHDHERVYALSFARELHRLDPWVRRYPDAECRPGRTVQELFDSLYARYLGAVSAEFDWTVNAVRAGQRPLGDLEKLAVWHPEILGLDTRCEAERLALEPAATAAGGRGE